MTCHIKTEADAIFIKKLLGNEEVLNKIIADMQESGSDSFSTKFVMPSYAESNSRGTMIKIVNLGSVEDRVEKDSFDEVCHKVATLHQLLVAGKMKDIVDKFPEATELTELRIPAMFLYRFGVKGCNKPRDIKRAFDLFAINVRNMRLSEQQQNKYGVKSNVLAFRFDDNTHLWNPN